MNTIALIPARGGSKGIKRKNIKLFNSKPLIYWSINAALKSHFIDRVVVSTDDQEIAEIAKSFSAEVPFLRPKEFAKDESPGIEPVLHALEMIPNVKEILLLQPTSPLRQTYHIDQIFSLKEKFKSESIVSVSKAKNHSDLFFQMNSNNIISPVSKSFKAMPRQKYPDLYTVNGALYLSSKKSILQHKSLFSSTSLGYIMSERDSIDIDTELDWEIAEFLMKKIL